MKKINTIICYLIICAFFIFLIISSFRWQLTLIGVLALILLIWACSKRVEREEQLAKKTFEDVTIKLNEQVIEKTIDEPEKRHPEKDDNPK